MTGLLALGVIPGASPAADDAWFANLRSQRVESDPSIVWRQFGPGMSGNNYRLFWHPTDPNIVFLGPNMGNAYRSTDRGTTYETILDCDGPGYKSNERGPIELTSPDFSRQNPDFGFCGARAPGLLYTTADRGRTWTRHTVSDPVWGGTELDTIAVDPTDDRIWYVGSGSGSDINHFTHTLVDPHGAGTLKGGGLRGGIPAGYAARIWKTTDRGAHWHAVTPTGLNLRAQIVRVVVDPARHETVYAATSFGFYKSTDGGSHWKAKTGAGLDHDIIRSLDMHYDPTSGAMTLYALDLVQWAVDPKNPKSVTNDGGGLFRSTDRGESWQKINGDLGVNIAVLGSDYAFRKAYFKSLEAWFGIKNAEKVYPVLPPHLMHSFLGVRVDPRNPNKIFLLNDYKSQPTTFFGGMLWRTDDGGRHWIATLRNGTAWAGNHKAYWEGRGNPTSYNLELRGQKKWSLRDSYERKAGGSVGFNSDGTMIMYQWAKVLCVSTDGGDTWVENDEIEATPGTQDWVGAGDSNLPGHGLRQDPRLPEVLFCMSGENDLWVTTADGGNVRPGAQAARRIQLGDEEYSCSDMTLDPRDPNVIYTVQARQAHAGELLRSGNGGQTFQSIGTVIEWPDGQTKNSNIAQLCLTLDPENPANMYLCVLKDGRTFGYTGANIGAGFGVRRSSDGGATWAWANKGLASAANANVPCLRLDPRDSSKLYAGVYGQKGGLFVSTDRAASWSALRTFPVNITSVLDLHFSKDGKMYVSCGTPDGKWQDGGVWVSADGGRTWNQIFQTPCTRMTKTAAYDPKVILVALNSEKDKDIRNPGTYLSKDGGISWTKINRGNPQSDRVNDIAIDQVKPDVYYVSTYGAGWLRADRVASTTSNGNLK